MNKLQGIIIPAVTPFKADGGINFDALCYNYERWNRTAVDGYMALGSNGEFLALDDEESLAVIKAASAASAPDKCFIAGIARESLAHTLKFMHRVANCGARVDYFSILTPHYFRKLMTDDALYAYFTAIADESPLPCLLYCAPAYANSVVISPELLKRLADHPNIYGIKDTSPDMMDAYMDACGGRSDFEVFSGSISTILHCMERGGLGGVVSAANYFPDECAEFLRLYREGGREGSLEYYTKLAALSKATGGRGSVAGVKACMTLLGYRGGLPRVPVMPVSEALVAEMREALADEGKL